MTELTVDFTDDGDRAVLALAGELDIDSVAGLREQVQARLNGGGVRALTLDLAGLTFVDSSGLGLLLELRRLALTADVAFRLANVPAGPARVIAIAGLTDTFGLAAAEDGPTGS